MVREKPPRQRVDLGGQRLDSPACLGPSVLAGSERQALAAFSARLADRASAARASFHRSKRGTGTLDRGRGWKRLPDFRESADAWPGAGASGGAARQAASSPEAALRWWSVPSARTDDGARQALAASPEPARRTPGLPRRLLGGGGRESRPAWSGRPGTVRGVSPPPLRRSPWSLSSSLRNGDEDAGSGSGDPSARIGTIAFVALLASAKGGMSPELMDLPGPPGGNRARRRVQAPPRLVTGAGRDDLRRAAAARRGPRALQDDQGLGDEGGASVERRGVS